MTDYSIGNIQLTSLANLKGIRMYLSENIVDFPTIPISLPRLELIHLWKGSMDDILPSIRHSVYL